MEGVQAYEPTGLAYDAVQNALLVTDGSNNLLYRVSLSDASTELLYQHGERPNAPGFDGLTITSDGVIYIAALGQNGIARLDGDTLVYIAGLFRGSSDIDHDSGTKRLYVTNFDSASLAYTVLAPRLPFALDVIQLAG
jgi:DNA-binding beta-propeller fold protein YncE